MREDLRNRAPLDVRGQRAVAEVRRERDAILGRVREFALAIVCANDAARVRRLALALYEGGLVPESVEWGWTSRLMADLDCTGVCKQCGGEVREGEKGRKWDAVECPGIYQALCPAEFGAVRYAEVCAA